MHKPKKFKKNMTTEEWACHLSEQKIRWAANRKKKTTYKQCFNTQIQIDKWLRHGSIYSPDRKGSYGIHRLPSTKLKKHFNFSNMTTEGKAVFCKKYERSFLDSIVKGNVLTWNLKKTLGYYRMTKAGRAMALDYLKKQYKCKSRFVISTRAQAILNEKWYERSLTWADLAYNEKRALGFYNTKYPYKKTQEFLNELRWRNKHGDFVSRWTNYFPKKIVKPVEI